MCRTGTLLMLLRVLLYCCCTYDTLQLLSPLLLLSRYILHIYSHDSSSTSVPWYHSAAFSTSGQAAIMHYCYARVSPILTSLVPSPLTPPPGNARSTTHHLLVLLLPILSRTGFSMISIPSFYVDTRRFSTKMAQKYHT